ncbi:MAG: hypothetical protein QM763_19145 [Agriterribacter sp.]
MIIILRILKLLFFILTFLSCSKSTESESSDEEIGLSDSDLQAFENMGQDTTTKFEDIVFSDNTNIQKWMQKNDSVFFKESYKISKIQSYSDKKRLLTARMQLVGFLLTTRSKFTDAYQRGLAYIWNSKDYLSPSACSQPPKGEICQCSESFKGLDCSGMIYQMANLSSLPLPKGNTSAYANTQIWKTALENSEFKRLIAIEYDKLPLTKIQTGDFVDWPSHWGSFKCKTSIVISFSRKL